MRALLTAVIAITLLTGTAIAQPTAAITSQDETESESESELSNLQLATLFTTPATAAQLNTLAQNLQLGEQAKGEFQQTRSLAVLKRPLKSAGQFIFSQNIGLLWQQTSPFNSTLLLKQNTLIQQDSLGNITQSKANQTSAAMAEQLPQLMQALLTGDLDVLAQDFDLFMLEAANETPDNNSENTDWQLGLVAKDPLTQQAIGAMVLEGGNVDGKQQINRLTMLSSLPQKQASATTDKTLIHFSNVVQELTEEDVKKLTLLPVTATEDVVSEAK